MGLFPNPLQRYKKYLTYANKIAFFYKKIAFFYNLTRDILTPLSGLGRRPARGLLPRCVARFPRVRYAVRGVTPAAGPSYRMPPSSGRVQTTPKTNRTNCGNAGVPPLRAIHAASRLATCAIRPPFTIPVRVAPAPRKNQPPAERLCRSGSRPPPDG